MPEAAPLNQQINQAWQQLGMFGALPWAAFTTVLAWVGAVLLALPVVAPLGGLLVAFALLFLPVLGLGGIRTRPLGQALAGAAAGVTAGCCVDLAIVVGLAGPYLDPRAAGWAGAAALMVLASLLSPVWARLRWGASPVAVGVVVAWTVGLPVVVVATCAAVRWAVAR